MTSKRISRVFKYKYLNVLYEMLNTQTHTWTWTHSQGASAKYDLLHMIPTNTSIHDICLREQRACSLAEISHISKYFLRSVAQHVSVAEAKPYTSRYKRLAQLCAVSHNKWPHVHYCESRVYPGLQFLRFERVQAKFSAKLENKFWQKTKTF